MIGYTDIVAKGINVGWAFMSTRFFRQPERKCVGNKCPPYACCTDIVAKGNKCRVDIYAHAVFQAA